MSTSAAAAAGTVRLYCSDCSTGFSLPAPSSPFDFTLCPRCRRGYLDDRPAPYPLPPPMWPSSPSSRSSRSAMLPRPPPPPPWIHSWSSSSSTTTLPPPPPPPPPLPRGSSSPSPSSPSAMLPPPPPPLLWIPSSSPFSSTTTLPPPPPPPCVPSSSASSSSPKTLPRTPPSPCTRASSSSTGLPPPPPPTTSSGTTTSSAAPVLYYCPGHFAVATRKEPPFPLSTLERCPSCRVRNFHNDAEHPVSSTTVSPISSTYSSASSSPLWLPPPPPPPPPPELYQGELQPGSPPLTMERTDFVDANVGLQPSPTLWITRLPVITVANNEVLCANCTNPILGRGRRLPCGHQYHTSCIMPWLLRRNSCPVWGCQCSLQGSSPPPPPRPPSLTSMPSNTWDWDYSSSPSAEEPPVSIYASLIDSPVHRGGSQAAPAASIAALPTVIVSDTAEVCTVCTEPLPLATAARRLPCGHLYHSECIVSWLSRHNSCPVCRRSIPMFPSTTAETALPPPPPLSIYASLIDSPVHRGGSQAVPAASIAALPTVTVSDTDSPVHVHRGGSQAAPAASIAALPTVTVSDTAEVCVICTEPFPLASAARRLPCGHLYHSDCIVSWLSRHNSCPVCRRSIPMFPSPTAETAPSPSLPQPTPGRRRSLPGVRRIRRICHRLLRYMEISRGRQPNRSGNIVHG